MKKNLLLCLLAVVPSLHADVTYVDATLANTDIATGGIDSLWADGDDSTTGGTLAEGAANNDGLWRFRSGIGNNGIWEATGSSAEAEDCAELVTSVAVADETYNVYVFYYAVSSTGNYPIRAGFASNPNSNTIFNKTVGQDAATLTYAAPPPAGDENRTLLYGLVGQVEVTDGSLRVYIDDFPASSTGSSTDRTWFAGIAHEVAGSPPVPPTLDQIKGTLISIDPDAGWTWYTDERAIIDFPRLIAGGVRGKSWFGAVGDIVGTSFDLTTGQRSPFVLGPPPIKDPANINSGDTSEDKDDHNAASFIKLPDGHYVTSWSSHSENNQVHFRKSTNPNDATLWDPEQVFERTAADGASGPNDVSYTNLHYLSDEGTGQGRLYNFIRNDTADDWDRYFIISDDLGATWQWGGRQTGQNNASIRPYPKYANNGKDTIYFITTEDNSGNSIWSGYLRNGKSYKMDGTVVDENIYDNSAFAVGNYTPVMLTGSLDAGTPMTKLWTRDLELDGHGNLAAVWRGYANGTSSDIRQFYGRWDGSQWIVHRMAYTGDSTVVVQQDGSTSHTGTPLSALNPANVNVAYFSANVDPATNAPLFSAADGRRNYEIFRAETADNGMSWTYTQITRDSSCHNFRLTVVPWDGNNTAVMWMRGYYDRWYFNATEKGWDTTLVAWLDRADEASDPRISYTDADLSNTTLADGTPLSSYTTGAGSGADDNNWHYRTNPLFGNNGTLFTANESAPYTEDCPVLKTIIPAVGPGTYDVFACFWSAHGNDYDVMAGLDGSSLTYLERQSSQHAPASEFDTVVSATDTSRHLYRGYVGRVTLVGTEPIEVFIDQFASGASTNNRTWFDGIALQRVGSAASDSDGDGQSDADEVIAGTDLFNPGDLFTIDSIGVPGGVPGKLDISGKAGRVYRLWRSTDLVNWAPVGLPLDPLATDATVQFSDPSPPSGKAFYRIAVSLP